MLSHNLKKNDSGIILQGSMEGVNYITDTLTNGVTRILAVDGDEKIVGSAFVGDDGEGNNFGPIQVNPTHRRRGIGKTLLVKAGNLLDGHMIGKFGPEIGMEREVEGIYKSQGFIIIDGRVIKT